MDQQAFREAASRFPSGVTIVTTLDRQDAPAGFTASAFCSLSLDPPLVLVCLQDNADCYQAFQESSRYAVSILSSGQSDIALRFATKGVDKFAGLKTEPSRKSGLPLIPGAAAYLDCEVYDKVAAGDHSILVGRVQDAASYDRDPLLYFSRSFGHFVEGEP